MFARISTVVVAGFLLVALGGLLQTTAAQTNKEVVQRVADEVWNQGNLAAADELFAADFVNHDTNPGGVTDLDGYKGWVLKWRAAFPDYQVEVDDLVAEGDKVGARCTVTGTHQGDFFGVAATGTQVTMKMINIYRLAGGKIAEAWWSYDLLGVGQQIAPDDYVPTSGPPLSFLYRSSPEDFTWGEPSAVTGDPGDPESNKALVVREELEGWNQGDVAVALEVIAPTFVWHSLYPDVVTYEEYVQWIQGHIDPEDPTQITLEFMFAEGDKVAVYGTVHGGTLTWMQVWRSADGKMVEMWRNVDVLPVFIAGGLVPPFPEFTAVESRTWGQIKSLFK